MKYLQYMVIGALFMSGIFAKELPEDQAWNNFRFAPKLAGDAPAYSLINIGNFGYWQKYDAYSAHTPSGNSGGIYPRGTAANIYLDGVLVGGYTGGNLLHVSGSIYTNGMVSGYVDANGDLEDCAELIQLDENKRLKQVRFSPRLDFVPLMDKEKLELYYAARNKISEMYNSEKFRIEFKLKPGDLLMMDNYRLLHGRTEYNANEGNRFLQGCYIDYDSTEGKLKHLKRKFNI